VLSRFGVSPCAADRSVEVAERSQTNYSSSENTVNLLGSERERISVRRRIGTDQTNQEPTNAKRRDRGCRPTWLCNKPGRAKATGRDDLARWHEAGVVTHAKGHSLSLPVLERFLTDGTCAERVIGVVPTVTYPAIAVW
jgi:hypothetical protein